MNISEASAQSGLSSKIIRRYEELGIIPLAGLKLSGQGHCQKTHGRPEKKVLETEAFIATIRYLDDLSS